MSLVEHLRTAAKIARDKDGLIGIPDGLDAAADRIEQLEAALGEAFAAMEFCCQKCSWRVEEIKAKLHGERGADGGE